MSLKNKMMPGQTASSSSSPAPDIRKPRSLRLRLVIWYGALLTVMLIFFATLVWQLTTDALNQGVDSAVRAETRIADLELSRKLSATPPYWPDQLSLQTVDNYHEPGVIVKIVDTPGKTQYDSGGNSAMQIPLSDEVRQKVHSGQTVWYTVNVDNGRARVEALPIHAPVTTNGGTTTITTGPGPIIGILLIAKALNDMDATLLLLRTLLISVGIATLAGILLGGWAIAGHVLHPLAEMAKTARAIATATAHGTRIGNLSRRVRSPGGRDEMAQVIDTFNEMLTNLEQATQAQRRFVADASHELRAPLTTIQGNLAFLNRHINELPPEEQHTMLSDAHEETLRLAQLVEELLILARADATISTPADTAENETPMQHSGHQQPIELDRVVLQIIRQFRGRLSIGDSKLKIEVGRIEPIRVQGDEDNFRRVFVILLDNALKYNEPDTASRVIVSLERVDKEAVLRVRDTGIGIDPADLPHIFERFYRADRARSRVGTGLGLAIAETLIETLHGRITAESEPGRGSTFSVWLPISQP